MSRRSYQKQQGGNKSQRRERPRKAEASPDVQLPLCREELVELMQDSLASFATEMGLRVAAKLLEDEVDLRCGVRYERQENRQLTRYGRQRGVVTLAGSPNSYRCRQN
jgi:hypothetical protein